MFLELLRLCARSKPRPRNVAWLRRGGVTGNTCVCGKDKMYSNNTDILYSSQQEIKAVVRTYTLTHKEELNCTYVNNSKPWNTHAHALLDIHAHALLDIHPLSPNLHTLKEWSDTNAYQNPKLPEIIPSVTNPNIKTHKLNKNHYVHTSPTLPWKIIILSSPAACWHTVNDWYNFH